MRLPELTIAKESEWKRLAGVERKREPAAEILKAKPEGCGETRTISAIFGNFGSFGQFEKLGNS